jgi:hypothetical protein
MVIAVFLTVDGNFRYAVDMEGYGALQFFNEEKLSVTPARPNTIHKAVGRAPWVRPKLAEALAR